MSNGEEQNKAIQTAMINRLATAYQIPVTQVLIKAWLEALEAVDDLQLAHAVHKQFLRGEVPRKENRVGWMPTPEEFMIQYRTEKNIRREKKNQLQIPMEVKTKRVPMPQEFKDAYKSLVEKWSTKKQATG